MSRFLNFINQHLFRHPSSLDTDYLAAAVDVYDLEYRMRELDRRDRQALLVLYR